MTGPFSIRGQDIGPLIFLLFALGPLVLRALRGKKPVPRIPQGPPPPTAQTSPSSTEFRPEPVRIATIPSSSKPIFSSSAISASSTLPASMTGPGEIKPRSTFPRLFVLLALVLLAWLIWHSVSRKPPSSSDPHGRPASHRTTEKPSSPSRLI